MNALQKIRSLLSIAALLIAAIPVHAQPARQKYKLPAITCIDAKLPLKLSNINYNIKNKPAPIVAEKITRLLIDYYEDNGGDTSEEVTKIKDAYFRTVRLPYNNCQLYVVILKSPMSDDCHCLLFLYNPTTGELSQRTINLYTWALYDITNNRLVPSNLKKQFHINSPEIEASDSRNLQTLTLRWLRHNGTFNALEEATYRQNGVELDTISFKTRKL